MSTSVNGWDALIRINLTQVLLCTQKIARSMMDAGLGGSIINVSTIERVRAAPDFTLTDSLAKMAPAGEENAKLMVPMGRAGHVDEMAGAAVFLASELSSYVTGQTLHVDGGTAAAGGWYHHPDGGQYVLGHVVGSTSSSPA